jgi:hypothetical protein
MPKKKALKLFGLVTDKKATHNSDYKLWLDIRGFTLVFHVKILS